MEYTLDDLKNKTLEWSKTRKITVNGNPQTQALKLVSEMGEVCDGIIKDNVDEVKDGIGDCLVVLTNLSALMDLTLEECWTQAWNDIKDRKGVLLPNGNFVKSTDKNFERLCKENGLNPQEVLDAFD